MARDAYQPLIISGIVTVLLLLAGLIYQPLLYAALVMLLLTAFIAFFFRDPERDIPTGEGLIVSPADGKVVVVEPVAVEGGGEGTLVSIFLSVFDVHINRAPVEGRVAKVEYRRGRFIVATSKQASVENEQNVLTFDHPAGPVVCKQIAGLIARRIVCWVKPGERVERGSRIGLIKFGSRVDLILPPGVAVLVRRGDRVRGGASVIGKVGA